MKNNNENSTRFFSDAHEKSVCKALSGHQTANSGAGHFSKGDVLLNDVSLMIECKTCMKDKDSFSIKREWLDKNKQEKFSMRKANTALCFNFGPGQENYYVIDEKLMKFLVQQLSIDERD